MRVVISDFMSLDGVVQAPGGPQEDTDGAYVVSRTLTPDDLTWNNSRLVAADDVTGTVGDLRQTPGGDVQVMGSASLARTLISNDLVDGYRLMLEPILLGGGKRLFPEDGVARNLELVEVETSATGVLICTYRPATG